jgi:hypothetical protein
MGDISVPKKMITFNGINARTGQYFTNPISAQDLVKNVILKQKMQKSTRSLGGQYFALAEEYGDSSKISDSGWGIIFPASADMHVISQIEEALSPLIEYRKSQNPVLFKTFKGSDGYRWSQGKGEDFFNFARRHNAGIGPVNPTNIPYYLLLVGDPNSIPFSFQFALDAQYAVGRIHFDKLDDYYHYACSVVAAETGKVALPRQAAFFGTAHEGDEATQLSAEKLVAPLEQACRQISQKNNLGWATTCITREDAKKNRLQALMGGAETPALLFTATHGLEYPCGDEQQFHSQGALICQDYPGPNSWKKELPPEFYLAGEDIGSDPNLNLLGMVACTFACFGGGTPYQDEFAIAYGEERAELAKYAFLADLPKRLLSHPAGGALAVISHVDRAWTYSFQWDDGGQQLEAWRSVLFNLLNGKPVGKAMEGMNERYNTIAASWLPKLEDMEYEPDMYDAYTVAANWIMAKDARGYAILGDPAARIPLAQPGTAPGARTALDVKSPSSDALPEVLVLDSLSDSGRAALTQSKLPQMPVVSPAQTSAPAAEPETTQPGDEKKAAEQVPALARRQPETPYTVLDALVQMNRDFGGQMPKNYGLKEDVEKTVNSVVNSLTSALGTLSTQLQNFASDVTSLDVKTYVSQDLSKSTATGTAAKGPGETGTCIAWTHVKLDGDIEIAVPMESGEVNQTIWTMHKDMVDLAQANRAEMIKTAVESITRLITPLK